MSQRLLSIALSASLGACSYDLDALRGRDGGRVDARVDVGSDAAVTPDRVAPDVTSDVAADVTADVGPTRTMPMTGACNGAMPAMLTAGMSGAVGAPGSVTLEANTMGGGSAPMPPTQCGNNGMTVATGGSTRVYRYVMQSGTRLLATTNTGLCGTTSADGGHDTILAAYFSCGPNEFVSATGSCSDDDGNTVCAGSCATNNQFGCGGEFSTLRLGRLIPGDVVYLAVSSFNVGGRDPTGRFRLSVVENGLAPTTPPTVDPDAGTVSRPPVDHCTCPPALSTATAAMVDFPNGDDAPRNQLRGSSRSIFGPHPVSLRRLWGVSATLRLTQYDVNVTGNCANSDPSRSRAALDLIVGTSIVASVALDAYVGGPGVVRIPLITFAPIMLSGTPTFEYHLRNVDPADTNCVTLDVDPRSTDNIVTLYGAS